MSTGAEGVVDSANGEACRDDRGQIFGCVFDFPRERRLQLDGCEAAFRCVPQG